MTIELDDLGILTQVVDQLDQLDVEVVRIDGLNQDSYGRKADLWIRWNND